MSTIDLAIIIPTLNEEYYIGTLLDSIAAQTVQPKEIVVVDAQSPDRTLEEIEKRKSVLPQLRYYQIPKYTISRQRNYGAKQSTAENLLFLDADMKLAEPDCLQKYWQEVEKRKPVLAVATNVPLSNSFADRFYFWGWDLWLKVTSLIVPVATGMNIFVKRQAFEKVAGFDEEVKAWEDFEFVQRMGKHGFKLASLKEVKLHTSVRRFKKYGRIRMAWMNIPALFKIWLYGYRANKTPYEFGSHNPQN